MYKLFTDTEWELFQNIISSSDTTHCKSREEKELFNQVMEANWKDNTSSRPDFISDELMIEMFEIDDIVTTKKGKSNPQRKADARAKRTLEDWMEQFPEGTFHEDFRTIAHGDTRYNPEEDTFTPDNTIDHHNYGAYVRNFQRICKKHLNSISAYRENYPHKKLGFLIFDESTFYVPHRELSKPMKNLELLYLLPMFDKNFMKLLIKSDVDFVLWAFNNKYVYTKDDPHAQVIKLPDKVLISRDNFYTKNTKQFIPYDMESLEY